MHCYCQSTACIEQLASAGSRALGALLSKSRDNYNLGYGSFTKLFHACVTPILDYGLGSWWTGQPQCSKMDKVQSRACHFFCGLPKNVAALGVVGDMGWSPGVIRWDVESVHLYKQICRMSDHRLPKRLLFYDKHVGGDWSQNMELICGLVNRMQSWEEANALNISYVKTELTAHYQATWKSEIINKSKLANYAQLKEDLSAAYYITAGLPKHT